MEISDTSELKSPFYRCLSQCEGLLSNVALRLSISHEKLFLVEIKEHIDSLAPDLFLKVPWKRGTTYIIYELNLKLLIYIFIDKNFLRGIVITIVTMLYSKTLYMKIMKKCWIWVDAQTPELLFLIFSW